MDIFRKEAVMTKRCSNHPAAGKAGIGSELQSDILACLIRVVVALPHV